MQTHTVLSNVSKVTVKKHASIVIVTIEGAEDDAVIRIGCHPDTSRDVKLEVTRDDV